MKHYLNRIKTTSSLFTAFFLILCFTVINGCKDNESNLGVNLRPDGGLIEGIVTDSFTITTRSIREDSIQTDSLSMNILGSIFDPVFGLRKASVAFDLSLPEINIDFGADPIADSLVLSIVFDREDAHYGEFNSRQHIQVHRLTERLESGLSYSSDYQFNVGDVLADENIKFGLKDTAQWIENGNTVQEVGVLRLKLDITLANELLNAGAGVFGSNDAFQELLNGLVISAFGDNLVPGEGGIAGVNLRHSNSKMLLYYNDSLSKEFIIGGTAERVGKYEFEIDPQVSNQFSQIGNHFHETYILQGAVKTKIDIDGLYDLVKDGEQILINEAKLTFTINPLSLTAGYPAPERLLLLQPSAIDSSNAFIIDLVDEIAPPNASWVGNTNYGGRLDESEMTYTFRINRHLQDLLDTYLITGEKKDRGLYLIIPSDNPITSSRVVLDNSQTGERNIKLKVTYIKL